MRIRSARITLGALMVSLAVGLVRSTTGCAGCGSPGSPEATPPGLYWSQPSAGGQINASFNRSFTVRGSGFAQGTPAVLCSTLLPPTINALPAGTCDPHSALGCPCRFGSDGVQGSGIENGHVIAAEVLTGDLLSSGATFPDVKLGQGIQVMHFEAEEADGKPDLASLFFTFDVDTVPPVVIDFSLLDNDPANDGVRLRIGGGEGAAAPGQLITTVSVTASGATAGQPVRVFSGAAQIDLGAPVLDSALTATFSIRLTEANSQNLSAVVYDVAGNPSDGTPALAVDVDVTAPTVSIPASTGMVTSLTATPVDAGLPEVRSDDYVEVSLVLPVSDANLGGARLALSVWDAAIGGNAIGTPIYAGPLGATDTSATLPAVPLYAGHNYLEATLTDLFGNVGMVSARADYPADFYGPVVILEMWDGLDGGASSQSCGATDVTPCIADTLAPVSSRVQLDRQGGPGDNYCPPPPFDVECSTAGSDLRFTLSGCANSHPDLEDCATTPINLRIRSSLVGGTFSTVFNGNFTVAGDLPGAPEPASLFDQPGSGAYAFDAGIVRAVRLLASDKNGNTSLSNIVYVKLNQGGIVPEVVLMDDTPAPFPGPVDLADTDANGEVWLGAAYSVAASPTRFQANLRVWLPVLVGGQDPTLVELTCAPGECRPGFSTVSESTIQGVRPNFYVDFLGIDLPTSAPLARVPNTLIFTVTCGAQICGQREFTGIHADVDPPTYQFDRCSLCDLSVPYAGAVTGCAGCASHNGLDSADITGADAVWNADRDRNPATPTTFDTSAASPLRVLVMGIEDGQDVAVASTQGGLSGNLRPGVTGCGSTVMTCRVDFDALQIPSLASNSLRHILTLDFADKAGNPAVPVALRCAGVGCDPMDEAITALVDTVRPPEVDTVACIGESTTPTAGPALPRNTENASCVTYCGGRCSRTRGRLALRWPAPSDDPSGAVAVASYEILVAALQIPYSGTTHVACDTVVPGAPVEQTCLPPIVPQAPGTEEVVLVSGLYPHRSYCFAVVGVDDAGNRSAIATKQVQRDLPLLTDVPGLVPGPGIVDFDPALPNDDADAGAFYPLGGIGQSGVGFRVASIGDLDTDGRQDFAVSAQSPVAGVHAVDLFLSNAPDVGRDLGTPLRINGPADDYFGYHLAFGDLNHDALSDLAICSALVAGGRGAVYIYYGIAGIGIDATRTVADPDLPDLEPDVSLFGSAGAIFCKQVAIADVDGRGGDDLLVATWGGVATHAYAFGYWVGGSGRFPSGLPGGRIDLDLDTVGSGWDPVTSSYPGPSFPNRSDFRLSAPTYAGQYPQTMTTGDFDGDGIFDIAVSDHLADHGGNPTYLDAGEVYVYRGDAVNLVGTVGAPDTLPPALMHLLRFRYPPAAPIKNFGASLARIPAPRPGDAADWLYVKAQNAIGVVFKATAAGNAGITPRDPGTVPDPRVWPVGGTTAYWELDNTTWTGTPVASFGTELAALGELDGLAGVDIALAPTHLDSNHVFIFSYDAVSDALAEIGFVKRAIIQGGVAVCPGPVKCGFGYSVAGAGPQLVVSTWSSANRNGMVHLYR